MKWILFLGLISQYSYAVNKLTGDKFMICQRKMANQKTIVGIDHYGSGNRLVEMFEKAGYRFFHIESSDTHPTLYFHVINANRQKFKTNYIYQEDFNKLTEILKHEDIVAVVAGSESGVQLADQLANHFKTPRNKLEYSELKRNKYLMSEAVRAAGLDAVKQLLTNDVNEALPWIKSNTTYPVIVKPYDSAGTVGVKKCFNEEEVAKHFGQLLSEQNIYGKLNDKILVQEYLPGPEFVVNAVGQNGRHMISDMWQYHKIHIKGATDVYDKDELLPFKGEIQSQIVPYALGVLDAIHLKEGASHMELKLVPGRGPVLIEVGARMMGSDMPYQSSPALAKNRNQLDLMLIKYSNPEKFEKMLDEFEGYELRKNMTFVTVNAHENGLKFSQRNFNLVKLLPSYSDSWPKYKDGDIVEKTIDMKTQVGEIILAHPDAAQVEADYQKIREWERTTFFE